MTDLFAPYRASYRWILDDWNSVNCYRVFSMYSEYFILPTTGSTCYFKFSKYIVKDDQMIKDTYTMNLVILPPGKRSKYYISLYAINRTGGITSILSEYEVTIAANKLRATHVGNHGLIMDYVELVDYKPSDTLTFCCEMIELDVLTYSKICFDYYRAPGKYIKPIVVNDPTTLSATNDESSMKPENVEEEIIIATTISNDNGDFKLTTNHVKSSTTQKSKRSSRVTIKAKENVNPQPNVETPKHSRVSNRRLKKPSVFLPGEWL